MPRPAPPALCSLLFAALLLSCTRPEEQPGAAGDRGQERAPADEEDARAPADSELARAPGDSELVRAATDVIAFLRGEREFAGIAAADTVVLYMAPEGGDARARLPRAALADRGNWQLPAGSHVYPLVPPAGVDSLSLFPGAHANCWERPLAERFPDLATLPHVGTVLRPRSADSCLQTWNLTFVFERDAAQPDRARDPPRLVAVVYDQWEW